MPRKYGVRLHDDERSAPVLPEPRDPYPKQAVRPNETQTLRTGPLEYLELVTQHQYLELEGGA
jgi:hypothetical protein